LIIRDWSAIGGGIPLNVGGPGWGHVNVVVIIVVGLHDAISVGIIPGAHRAVGMKKRDVIVRGVGDPVRAQMRFITDASQTAAGIIVTIVDPIGVSYVPC
jgi:hypothetical protein